MTQELEVVETEPQTARDSDDKKPGNTSSHAGFRSRKVARRWMRTLGWILVVAGAVVLEFAAFLVWGTATQTARAQARLRSELGMSLTSAGVTDGSSSLSEHRAMMHPQPGLPLARIEIPAIGVDAVVVEGVGHEELKLGPGHIPETALPGRVGSSVISGHRTTYGAPFANIDRLQPGAEIKVTTVEGSTRYVVSRSYVVFPEDTSVTAPLKPGEPARLRLTTCHPRFSAARRLVVEAELVSPPTG